MSKKAFMDRIRKGKQNEIEVAGERFLVKAPELDKYGMIIEIQTQLERGIDIDFSLMAKVVIENTFNVDTEELYFSPGDFNILKSDRYGAVQEIAENIISLMLPDNKEKEEVKKN